MSMGFNADEVLEMALEIERNGADFYKRAAELGQMSKARAALLELAAMEEDHERTFAEMRAGLTEEERRSSGFADPEGELPLYLRVMADKRVLSKNADPARVLSGGASTSLSLAPPRAQSRGGQSIEEVLRFAIGMEKDSIVFYLGLQELVPERLGGRRVEQILREEMGHLATVGDLIRCYSAK
jgi:rubrerythrin